MRFGQTEDPVNIVWVFRPFQSSNNILISDGLKYRITRGESFSLVRSRLMVETLSANDVGDYVCQIEFRNNNTLAMPSQSLILLSSERLSAQRFASCSQFEAQSVEMEECALRGAVGDGFPRPDGADSGDDARSGDNGSSGSSGISSTVIWSIVGGLAGFIVLAIIFIIFLVYVQQCCCRPSPY